MYTEEKEPPQTVQIESTLLPGGNFYHIHIRMTPSPGSSPKVLKNAEEIFTKWLRSSGLQIRQIPVSQYVGYHEIYYEGKYNGLGIDEMRNIVDGSMRSFFVDILYFSGELGRNVRVDDKYNIAFRQPTE